MFGWRTSGQALHAGGPLQRNMLAFSHLEAERDQLGPRNSAAHQMLEKVLTGAVMVFVMVWYQSAAVEEESAWRRNSLPVCVVTCRGTESWLKFTFDLDVDHVSALRNVKEPAGTCRTDPTGGEANVLNEDKPDVILRRAGSRMGRDQDLGGVNNGAGPRAQRLEWRLIT